MDRAVPVPWRIAAYNPTVTAAPSTNVQRGTSAEGSASSAGAAGSLRGKPRWMDGLES